MSNYKKKNVLNKKYEIKEKDLTRINKVFHGNMLHWYISLKSHMQNKNDITIIDSINKILEIRLVILMLKKYKSYCQQGID